MDLYQLRTNLITEPLGVDSSEPEFSWKISTTKPGTLQSAYEIEVAPDESFGEESVIWKTGKIFSDTQAGVVYSGRHLQSFSRYSWKVRVWDQDDLPSQWSPAALFETAMLGSDWQAQWITPSEQGDSKQAAYVCAKFDLPGSVSRGRAYFSALGWYRLFINGNDVTGDSLVPRWTPYDFIVEYQAYDITQYLRPGTNYIGVAVGDGRYRGSLGFQGGRERYGKQLAVFGRLEVTTTDGQRITLGTDDTWKSAAGHILSSDPMLGESADLRISDAVWMGNAEPETGVTDLGKVQVIQSSPRRLVAESVERVRCIERLPAKQVLKSPSGKQIVDFGQNFAGWIKIKMHGASGTRVLLAYSEVLTKTGELDISYLCPPLRIPPQKDSVILSGEESWFETWFTIHGFRYVEIDGLDHTINLEDVEGKVVSSSLPRTGTFECSNPSVERFYRNLSWSVTSNFVDVPTDCPTRERSGWTGDLQVFSATATIFLDCQSLFRHFLRSLAVEQLPEGTIPAFIPSESSSFSGGLTWFQRMTASSTGWGDAAVLLPWTAYRYYADKRVLHDQYDSMCRWVNYLETTARTRKSWRRWLFGVGELERYIVDAGFHFGEWLRPGESPGVSLFYQMLIGSPSIPTAYLSHSSRILSQVARLLGKGEDAAHYEQLAESARTAWQTAFVRHDGSKIRIGIDKQDEYVRGIAFDLVNPEDKPAAVARLTELIEEAGYHLGTGFLSIVMLLQVLTSNGRADVAFRLLLQESKPSWLGLLEKDATTLWETWEGYDSKGNAYYSHNHYALGAFGIWLEECLAGLAPAEPGYRRIRVAPVIGGGFTYASATRDTPFGVAKSSWKVVDDLVHLDVQVPPGTTAEVHLGQDVRTVGSGVHSFRFSR